ncbi:MAG: heme lyase CcmF/NrfE family subunit [Alphaproteobacteria bacterium]|nr:heme lyase CcmF/NrfE family subunit [Alphaproteobacteria bacterium]
MIAELGHFALILALGVALAQASLPLWGAARGDRGLMAFAGSAALTQFLLVALAYGALTQAFLGSDFSVINVATNSHSQKPLLYKITGVWGNHEGSLLLWALILALFGAGVAAFGANLPPSLKARVLAVQAMIALGFLAFILFTSNPFQRIDPPPADGNGLNPLLQDPGLAFHPPFLYLGYVGFSIAFAFAIAALIEGRVDPAWARWVRPWTLAAWSFLTVGIALGSWWAYYELGWGGYWFWDPVENASLMPWLAGTALLHSATVVEKREALKAWTVLLAILTFSLSLLGTFLVRSGVLTSVHAFATDPARGLFILAFLAVTVGGSLALFAARAEALVARSWFAALSREGALVLNNLLLGAMAATVLLGTLYPLFLDALTGDKVSVGPPFFHAALAPSFLPLAIALGFGPLLAWKRGDLPAVTRRLGVALGVALAVALITLALADRHAALGAIGLGLVAWALTTPLVELAERLRLFRAPLAESWARLRILPRAAWGMSLAHFGVGLMAMGVVASEAWQTERIQALRPGDAVAVGPYKFDFKGARELDGPNYLALRGHFEVTRDGRPVAVMEPETRRYPVPPMTTTEAAIRPRLTEDLYAVVGEPDGEGGFATRLYHKPLVSWIWLGALVMATGGALSLSDRRHRVGAPVRARRAAQAATGD